MECVTQCERPGRVCYTVALEGFYHTHTHTHRGQVLCLSCLLELFNALTVVHMSARCPIEQAKEPHPQRDQISWSIYCESALLCIVECTHTL